MVLLIYLQFLCSTTVYKNPIKRLNMNKGVLLRPELAETSLLKLQQRNSTNNTIIEKKIYAKSLRLNRLFK